MTRSRFEGKKTGSVFTPTFWFVVACAVIGFIGTIYLIFA